MYAEIYPPSMPLSLLSMTDSPKNLDRKAFRAGWTAFISNISMWSFFSSRDYTPMAVRSCRCVPQPVVNALVSRRRKGESTWEGFLMLISPPEATNQCSPSILPRKRNQLHWIVQDCWPQRLQLPLKQPHSGSTLDNKMFYGGHVAQKLLPYLCRRWWKKKKLVLQLSNLTIWESISTTLSWMVFIKHPKILSFADGLKIQLLHVNNNPQVFAKIKELLAML